MKNHCQRINLYLLILKNVKIKTRKYLKGIKCEISAVCFGALKIWMVPFSFYFPFFPHFSIDCFWNWKIHFTLKQIKFNNIFFMEFSFLEKNNWSKLSKVTGRKNTNMKLGNRAHSEKLQVSRVRRSNELKFL